MKVHVFLTAGAVALLLVSINGLQASRRPAAPEVPNVSSVYFNTRTPAIVAHRGAADQEAARHGFTQETMDAYRYAAGLGVEVLEMDVHLTADGRLAVHHDDKLARNCSGKDSVSKLTMSQIKSCKGTLGYEIPELREIFQAFPGYRMMIEMKTPGNSLIKSYSGIAGTLWSEIKAHGMERYVNVSTFSSAQAKDFRALVNGVPTGLTGPEMVSFIVCYLPRLPQWACAGVPDGDHHQLEAPYVHSDLSALGIDVTFVSFVTTSFVAQARKYNYRLSYWTVNTASRIRRVFDVGADSVITDNPALAQSVR